MVKMAEIVDVSKLAVAMIFAAIAGLTVMVAGVMSDIRSSVILLRTFGMFFAVGVLVYIGLFLFEKLGYEKLIKETKDSMNALEEQEAAAGGAAAEETEAGAAEAVTADTAGGEAAAEPAEAGGFQPLQADNLRRVSGSAEG